MICFLRPDLPMGNSIIFCADEVGTWTQRHFLVAQGGSLIISFDSAEAESIARIIQERSPEIFSRLEGDFGIKPDGRITVVLFSRSKKFQEMPPFRFEPEWAAGEAFPEENTIVIVLDRLGRYPDLDSPSVFMHELSHIFLFDAVKGSGEFIPRWFNEGLAMLETRKWGMRDNFELASSLITGAYIPLESLTGSFPIEKNQASQSYVESFSFINFLAERYGGESLFKLVSEMKMGNDFESAFTKVFGDDLRDVERQWIDKITMWYRYVPAATSSITLWIAITVLFIIGYVRKKRRNAAVMKKWDEEDDWLQ